MREIPVVTLGDRANKGCNFFWGPVAKNATYVTFQRHRVMRAD